VITLTGKAAVVTGGSRGIGAATVKLLAQAGADVVFNYHRSKEAAQQVEQEARRHGVRVESLKTDLSKVKQCEKLIKFAMARLGRLDILVANAGIWNAEDVPIEQMSERQWDQMLAANLKSVYGVVRSAVAHMKAQGSGRIIAVSSTAGQRGEAFHTHYAASKGAIISFVKGLATELAPHGILVNCVAPGWVDTEMSQPVLQTRAGRKFATAAIPLGRVGTPEEIAGPIVFLASDWATFVQGEILNVNGGAVLCG
jgi:3-oxoacyl-[acyl-carrier protein] reductase